MNSPSREAVICIGSNFGDKEKNIERALIWLSEILEYFRHSNIYATSDCKGSQKEYLNAVAVGTTKLASYDLEYLCKQYELSHGRDSAARCAGNVTVDIDVVVYDGKILKERDYMCEFFQIGYSGLISEGA